MKSSDLVVALDPPERMLNRPWALRLLLAGLSLFIPCAQAQDNTLMIAAASDLKFAMDEIITTFTKAYPDTNIEVIYGSSGRFHAQIQRGAPYDLYFSADIDYARSLYESGHTASAVQPYAFGRIVLWSTVHDASQMTLNSLTDPAISRIAIANPRHAPYGMRAVEALKSTELYDTVESRLVYGENIAHAAHFVLTGNAQVGIIALALAVSPELSSKGSYWLIPEHLHQPLEQGFVITKGAEHNALAQHFADYMVSTEARLVMTRYGFVLPDTEAKTNTNKITDSHQP